MESKSPGKTNNHYTLTLPVSPELLYDNDSILTIPQLAFGKSPTFGERQHVTSVQRLNAGAYIRDDDSQEEQKSEQRMAYEMMLRRKSLQKTRNQLMVNNDFSYLTTQGHIANIQEPIPEYTRKKGRKSKNRNK